MKLGIKDKREILKTIKKGTDARQIIRANALNMRSKGLTRAEVADFLEITPRTVANIEYRFEQEGVFRALNEDPRPGRPVDLDDRIKSQIVAIVCSDPPEAFDRWTLRLIQEEVIKNGIVDTISHESVRVILEEHDLKPWRQRSWCVPDLDDQFIQRMEDVLKVYEKPYNIKYPVVCVDEKPIQLLDHVRPESGIAPGEERKIDYEYARKGTANVFCAVEPLQGIYVNQVTETRTGCEFAKFIKLISEKYCEANKIILIMDNLNIHNKSSLIKQYGPEQAEILWDRFEVHYTPVHGSWLNQAEIAIGMYSRQCLGKARIPDLITLKKKTTAWNRYANDKQAIIQWQFTRKKAREKFDYENGKN